MKSSKRLITKIHLLKEELSAARTEYEELTRAKKVANLTKYVGKCYREKNHRNFRNSVRCFYVYKVDNTNPSPELMALEVQFFKDDPTSFTVQRMFSFHPTQSSTYKYKQISKAEFTQYYKHTISLLAKIIS